MDYPGKIIRKTAVTPSQTSASGVWTVDDASSAVKNNNWPIAGVPNPISRSLRFNSADSAYLNRTPGSTTNRRTWTWSGWIKLGTIGNWGGLFNAGTSGDQFAIYLFTDSTLYVQDYASSANNIVIQPTQVFRDPSAWYHIVVAIDTTQATSSNRVKVYINGSQVTAFSTSTYPSQNYDTQVNSSSFAHNIGRNFQFATSTAKYFDGYMTEVNFIDGSALTPSSFGMTDPQTGAWIPIKYTGTYGTNGFYVNFKDNSSTGTLGYDYSGNSNNWTANNFSVTAGAGNDSLTDVPTPWIAYNTTGDVGGVVRGNYCTLNPTIPALTNQATTAISNGNLDFSVTQTNSNFGAALSTVGVSSGKWYFEYLVTNVRNQTGVGFINAANLAGFNGASYGFATPSDGWARASNGYLQTNSTSPITTLSTYTDGDIVICAVDFDAGKMWFGKNGTWDSSGNPGAGTNELATFTPGGKTFLFGVQGWTGSGSINGSVNFGQRPFAYTPPAGFRSLCTTNLPTPTIGATSTTQANDYFNAVLYTGNNSTLAVTGVGFQPDWVWIKQRSASATFSNAVIDAVRGRSKNLITNLTNAETTSTSTKDLTSFDSDGFSLGQSDNVTVNDNAATYVAWNWKANGAGSSNTAGSISSTVSANTAAGFSIVTYTGTGANATVGHGCLVNSVATAPRFIICKERNTAGYDWRCYHASLGATQYIDLNSTAAAATASTIWQDTAPTSTVFSVGTNGSVNVNTGSYVAYCFAEVAGYSAFGSYTGNGSSDGTFVYTGFRPKFVMVKNISATAFWQINDAARNPYNLANLALHPNSSNAEATYSNAVMDILSNGFKLRGNDTYTNTNTNIYIYAAFAEFPFKFSNAR